MTPEQLVATGAVGTGWGGLDPVDKEAGWRPAGSRGLREIPWWTAEKARIYAVNAYRANPMAKAIIDTYTAFCVGDSGVKVEASNPDVLRVADEFWTDPRNQLGPRQELFLRSHLLMGESLQEMMVGSASGVVRLCPIDVGRIQGVDLLYGNPLWPATVWLDRSADNDGQSKAVVMVSDETGLREGEAMFWPSFKALDTDIRGFSFLGPILDQLDSYDTVLSNLIDRTALARYLVWDVTVEGGQTEVDNFVAARGGTHIPPSGSVEVHNSAVKWEAKQAETGAYEDSAAARSVLTQVAGGAGLAKTWLAEPDDANRATSLTMAEPVRRRVGGVQQLWLGYQTELVRFAVDRAVSASRLPRTVTAIDPRTGTEYQIPASQAVTVRGPEVAAADAQITAQVMLNISTGLQQMVEAGVMTREAARVAAKKAWEDYMGVPYTAALDSPDANPDDLATVIDAAEARRTGDQRRAGAKTLHDYWTKSPEGRAKWVNDKHPWTALYRHLLKHMDGDVEAAKRTASKWYEDVFGHMPAQKTG